MNHCIIERPIAAVRALLLETNQSANQIAEAVGYQHEGDFFYQFRQYHGSTPQAWREAQRTQSSTQQK
ncbi:helix-turn-helix domain-containing protein [Nostoc sp.]|uniref:helix-turn-helix domain-containing protein n=1 Tax=Nostoc sp. TaxID=1180 RepID=UPI0035930D5C